MNGINAFLEQTRSVLRLKHLSLHTEETYLSTIRRFIEFHGKRHPAALGPDAVREYLTYLATEQNVAASTQNVARNALLFLYRDVLETETAAPRQRRPATTPRTPPRRPHPRRSQGAPRPPRRHTPPHGRPALRQRAAPHGVPAPAGQGRGLRLRPDHRPRRQRAERPRHHAPRVPRSPRSGRNSNTPATPHRHDLAERTSPTSSCPMPWTASTRTPGANGPGSGSSPPPASPPIRAPA